MRNTRNLLLKGLIWAVGIGVTGLFAGLLLYVLVKGLSSFSLVLFSVQGNFFLGTTGILPYMANTLYLLIISLGFGLPAGIGAAIFYSLFMPRCKGKPVLRFVIDSLAITPTIAYSMVGIAIFTTMLGFGTSLLAASCTMALVVFVRTVSEGVRIFDTVSLGQTAQACSLGASRFQILYTVMLPKCWPSLVAHCFRSALRVLGETTLLVCMAGAGGMLASSISGTYNQSGGTLTAMLYTFGYQRGDHDTAFAMAVILLLLVLVITGFSRRALKRDKHKTEG